MAPEVLTLLHDQLEFFGGVVPVRVLHLTVDAKYFQDLVAERVQREHERKQRVPDPEHRWRDPQRHLFRILQRDRLRHHLTNDDVKVGQDGYGNSARQSVRREPFRQAMSAEHAVEPIGEDVFAIHAEPEARDCDAELCRCDVSILLFRIVEHALNEFGEPVAVLSPAIDRRPRRADDGKLGGDEHPFSTINPAMIRTAITTRPPVPARVDPRRSPRPLHLPRRLRLPREGRADRVLLPDPAFGRARR